MAISDDEDAVRETEEGNVEILDSAKSAENALDHGKQVFRVAVQDRSMVDQEEFISRTNVRSSGSLPHQPLTVMLPHLSDVGELEQFSELFQARFKQLKEGTEQGQREKQTEESMLLQVLQWLQISGEVKR